jgi:tRNA (mo5U34)-methyltransferase
MTASSIEHEVRRLAPWFHNLHLPDGTQTCPEHVLGDFPSFKWRAVAPHLPQSLDGWTALDVGCNAGFYSFELARRGARVTAIDVDSHYLDQARWAAGQSGVSERIEFQKMQVYDLARRDQRWDLVLFMGVFYHLRYPLLGLDIVSRCVGKCLVFQTLTLPGEQVEATPGNLGLDERDRLARPGWPKMAFIEHSLADDQTNWWAPNHAGVEAMLRSTGMRVAARPAHEIYLCTPDRENASSMWRWDEREYSAAVGRACDSKGGGPPDRRA